VNLRQIRLSIQPLHIFANAFEIETHIGYICIGYICIGDRLVAVGDRYMLIFTRKVLESLRINGDVTITVLHVRGDQVRLRFTSPQDVGVYREEVVNELTQAAKHALSPPEVTR
jgi:carbon storage regulator